MDSVGRVYVQKSWGQSFDPDLPSVLITNDNIAELWPRIPAEQREQRLTDGFVFSLEPPPDYSTPAEVTPPPAPAEPGEPAARLRRTTQRAQE
jgi:hypothetical protein